MILAPSIGKEVATHIDNTSLAKELKATLIAKKINLTHVRNAILSLLISFSKKMDNRHSKNRSKS